MADKVTPERAEQLGAPRAEEAGGLPPEKGLEILGTDPEEFQTSQGKLFISPMGMGQLRKFLLVSEKFLPVLQEQMASNTINMVKVMNADQDAFLQAVAIGASTTPETLDKLTPQEFIRICTKVLLVNLDFFVKTLPALLGGVKVSVGKAVAKLEADGHALYKDLSEQVTASPT